MNDINLETIDVKMLKQQKLALVKHLAEPNWKPEFKKNMGGIINLLDYIQDTMELEPEEFDAFYNCPRKDDLKFVCPLCGCRHLDQTSTVDLELKRVLHIRHDGELVYGNVRTDGQNGVEGFVCSGCEFIVVDDQQVNITEDTELAKWLKKQPYNQHKKQRKGKT